MPLRLIHTADWHLCQQFHGFDRDHEHGCFLDWLLGELIRLKPDALVLSGDVFDTVNPSAAAQRRFFGFLARSHAALPGLQFLITAGNHDAGARLEAPAGLLEALNITVIGTVPRNADGSPDPARLLVPLRDASGAVAALAVAIPFLRHADVPPCTPGEDPYLGGVRELYRVAVARAEEERDRLYPGAALLALGHCHVAGGDESRDSERRLVIGGSEAVPCDVFPPSLSYVALGHLHKPQHFEGGRIRYCGSPIPLSFSEIRYGHRVLLITLDGAAPAQVEELPVPTAARLLRLPTGGAAPLEAVLAALTAEHFDATLPQGSQPYLEVQVLNDGPDPTRRSRIEKALEGRAVRLASIKLVTPTPTGAGTQPAAPTATLADLNSIDPADLLADAHRERHQSEPSPELLAALREILAAETANTEGA